MMAALKNTLQRFLPARADTAWLDWEQMPFGMVALTPHNGRIVRVNERFARWVGRTPQALENAAWQQLTLGAWHTGKAPIQDMPFASEVAKPEAVLQSFFMPDGQQLHAALSLLTRRVGA